MRQSIIISDSRANMTFDERLILRPPRRKIPRVNNFKTRSRPTVIIFLAIELSSNHIAPNSYWLSILQQTMTVQRSYQQLVCRCNTVLYYGYLSPCILDPAGLVSAMAGELPVHARRHHRMKPKRLPASCCGQPTGETARGSRGCVRF